MAFQITVGGVDITPYVNEKDTFQIEEALDQRTATCEFIVRDAGCDAILGMKEIEIFDNAGHKLYGGFAAQISDASDTKTHMLDVQGIDYTQRLSHRMCNEIFIETGDVTILRTLLIKYAPWVDLGHLPSGNTTIVPRFPLNRKDLLTAIRQLSDVTGYVFWVDNYKNANYQNPDSSVPAPFGISDHADNLKDFSGLISKHELDYTNLTNRVFVIGGTTLSSDYTQDMSVAADGTNKVFFYQYRPKGTSRLINKTHKIEVYVDGEAQVVGTENFNNLKPQDIYDCLVNLDEKLLRFAFAPRAGAKVITKYRYEIPILLAIQNIKSFRVFGDWFDAKIADNRIVDASVAQLRGQTIVNQFSFGETVGQIDDIRVGGLHVGQNIPIYNRVRNINGNFLIRQLTITSKGNGDLRYSIQYGHHNRSLIDQYHKLNIVVNPDDTFDADLTNEADATALLITVDDETITSTFIDAATFNSLANHHYYPGGGAFPGFSVPTGI